MTKVRLICVGTLKERFYAEACAEYEKRLRRFCDVETRQLSESGDLNADGERVLKALSPQSFVTALCIEGEKLSSPALAERLMRLMAGGRGDFAFLIGGSEGLADKVKRRADARLSMSDMTFPHHLARVMLLEQLYRSFMILNNGKYHK